MLIASTSTVYGSSYLDYILDDAMQFFGSTKLLFIPFARPSGLTFDDYTELPRKAFEKVGMKVRGLHEFSDMQDAILSAEGIFVGGGNSFLLLKTLYDFELMESLRAAVERGVPFMGSSAGSNIAGMTIGTTNDMPIIQPPTFEALGFLPFNINPHYLDPDPNSTHKGETRETRINEFHVFNEIDVLGLREGSWLRVEGGKIKLQGGLSARLFQQKNNPRELEPGLIDF